MKKQQTNLIGSLIVAALLTGGCDEQEPVRVYTAPKDPPRKAIDFAALATGQASEPQGRVTWDVPAGWTEADAPPPLMAGWSVGDTRITVSRLAGEGGGTLANINRWRGQIGLPPVERLEDQPMRAIDIAGHPAALVDLPGEQQRIAAVLYPRVDQNATWFLKMTGPPEAAGEQMDAFAAFAQSLRFAEDAEPPSDPSP